MSLVIESFFDPVTGTVSYVVFAAGQSACAVIDPVLDYDAKSGRTRTASADRLIAFIQQNKLQPEWLLETHAHADHLSASHYLKEKIGGKTAIGAGIALVQNVFKGVFNLEPGFTPDGRQFDHLLQDGECFSIGPLQVQAMSVPGHTPACMAYHVDDAVFVGDTLFMPDVGTARCDFPGGDARVLYQSVRKLLSLPPATRLFMCHDYPPASRQAHWQTTVGEQRAYNIHLHDGVSEEAFFTLRTQRDATLDMPTLILPAVQINIRAGAMPPPESNGVAYLKIPLNQL